MWVQIYKKPIFFFVGDKEGRARKNKKMLDALPSELVMGQKRRLKKLRRELKQIKRDNGKAEVTYLAKRYEGVPAVADED